MRQLVVFLGLAISTGCSCGDDGGKDADAGPPDAGADATPEDGGHDAGPVCPPDLHVEDAEYEEPECPTGPAAGQADRLAEALEIAGLTRDSFGWSDADWSEASYRRVLFDDFVLSEFRPNHDEPVQSACHAADITGRIDHAIEGTHTLSAGISHAAARLDRPVDEAEPEWEYACDGTPLASPIHSLLLALGGSQSSEEVATAVGDVPLDLQVALAPVVIALTDAVQARADAWVLVGEDVGVQLGGTLSGILHFDGSRFQFDDGRGGDSAVVMELKRRPGWLADLYQAGYDLAVALDHARPALLAQAGATGFDVDFDTPGGRVLIKDGEDHTYEWDESDRSAIALLVDTGGDDTYRVPVGGVTLLQQSVALGLDLGGQDFYGYAELVDPNAGVGHRIPMDSGGRYRPDGSYGPFSLSDVCRQGGARFGIAILEDLGGGNDEYRTLRLGQGFAAAGVGILHDDGGDDVYTGEAGVQGSAMFGIGMLIDEGGTDRYVAYHLSQGLGYTAAAGFLVDAGGSDEYVCDHGIPEEGGDPMYYSPQRPGTGNSSFCQGGGFGLRGDSIAGGTFWSGGLGVLRDRDGNDSYEASVFGQGAGYWSGIGLLSDGGGDDRYEAIWYVQAGSAHYATAILLDSGDGNDVFNDNEWTVGVGIGSGHDYSLGLLINEGGDDRYFAAGNGAGTGNCNGIGIFVDNGGSDSYRAPNTWNFGHAHVSGECDARRAAITDAVFLDVGGDDTYDRTGETLVLDDDVSWTQTGAEYESEHGVGLDAPDGDSTLHAP